MLYNKIELSLQLLLKTALSSRKRANVLYAALPSVSSSVEERGFTRPGIHAVPPKYWRVVRIPNRNSMARCSAC